MCVCVCPTCHRTCQVQKSETFIRITNEATNRQANLQVRTLGVQQARAVNRLRRTLRYARSTISSSCRSNYYEFFRGVKTAMLGQIWRQRYVRPVKSVDNGHGGDIEGFIAINKNTHKHRHMPTFTANSRHYDIYPLTKPLLERFVLFCSNWALKSLSYRVIDVHPRMKEAKGKWQSS